MNNEVNNTNQESTNNVQEINNSLGVNQEPQLVIEQPVVSNNVEPQKKKGKGKTIVIILLVLLVLGLGGFIVYDKFINKKESNITNECPKCEISDNNNQENNAETNKLINFDRTKCINNDFSKENLVVENIGYSEGNPDLSLNAGYKTVTITARYDIMHPEEYTYDKDNGTYIPSDYMEEKELNFEKDVEYIFAGLFSNNSTDTVYFFLLEDGSLEYMKYQDIYKNRKYEHKKINGVNDIVRFDNIIYNDKNAPFGDSFTAIAYKMDGTYYDLSKFIENLYD